MRTLVEARRLINSSDEPASMDEILVQLGFTGPARALDPLACDRLGLPRGVARARVARGDGALRALVVEISVDGESRHVLTTIARQLSTRVPHLLWLIVAVQIGSPLFTVMVWRTCSPHPQLLALTSDRGAVVDSDAETLCALAACTGGPSGDVMRHLRWTDVLGREAVTRRFYRALENSVGELTASLGPHVPTSAAREIALLTTSRLLFLSFVETKGWLNADFGFLANGFADCVAAGGGYHRRVLEPLFFGTLNTRTSARAARARAFGRVPFLNGGLFARSALERQWRRHSFSDEALGAFFGDLLVRYRFTSREGASGWSDAAIDPEILGKAFESLMSADERKKGGVFYTPQALVERLTVLTLVPALTCAEVSAETVERALEGRPLEVLDLDDRSRAALLDWTSRIRVLDPACGSGAFLVHVLERLSVLRANLGDARPMATIRRSVLTRSIYGVDVNPIAVWLCELRLWLAAVIESDERDPMRVIPLPNLDRQIRVGDSLAGTAFAQHDPTASAHPISRLRQRYTRATGRRKVTLARELDRAERRRAVEQIERALVRACAERRELLWSARATDLFDMRVAPDASARERLAALRRNVRSLRARRLTILRGGALAFSYATHFGDAADAGGFDVVIGNPPWIRIHNISAAAREAYREQFETFRHAAWASGATVAGAGSGFGGQSDASALFLERSRDLVKTGGTVGLLLPSKLWHSLAGGGIRQLVQRRMHMRVLEDFSDAPTSFDAAVYPSILVATARAISANDNSTREAAPNSVTTGVQHGATMVRWTSTPTALALDESDGSPWMLVPPAVRAAFDRVRIVGTPMARAACGRPWLGVKTGCNAAFVVRILSCDGDVANVASGDRRGRVESSMLRPLVRGETLTPWALPSGTERIVWTHDARKPLDTLPPFALQWLSWWRHTLERRSDARRCNRWWSLFRVEASDHSGPRVVWNDVSRTPRAAILLPGDDTVPLNSCYVARCETVPDAYTLTALLNSPLAAAWLSIPAEPARGGYHRYLGWTMSMLPLPSDWLRACDILAPLTERAIAGDAPSKHELHRATLAAYRLRPDTVAPLMEWAGQP